MSKKEQKEAEANRDEVINPKTNKTELILRLAYMCPLVLYGPPAVTLTK